MKGKSCGEGEKVDYIFKSKMQKKLYFYLFQPSFVDFGI